MTGIATGTYATVIIKCSSVTIAVTVYGFIIPKTVTTVILITVGHTIGTDFRPAARPPASTVTDWNTWTA